MLKQVQQDKRGLDVKRPNDLVRSSLGGVTRREKSQKQMLKL